jgi:hypothetical protein
MTPFQHVRSCIPILFLAIAGCSTGPSNSEDEPIRETLENGATLIQYADFPTADAIQVDVDLRIGVAEGAPEYMFGDVRGFDAAQNGTIFVLDYQAAEIRAYDETGTFLRTVAAAGPGPGEIDEANGLVLRGDSVLWIQDHGQWLMKGFGLDGRLIDSFQMPVRAYGYIWDGSVDNKGSVWKLRFVSNAPPEGRPPPGLREGRGEQYFVGFSPGSQRRDSVYLGVSHFRSFVVEFNNGGFQAGIPHDPAMEVVLDPDGGFWQARTDAYRIARLSETGDTTLVVNVDASPVPVTDDDVREFSDAFLGRFENRSDVAREIVGLMPENKPIIVDLVVDDMRRLWVRRQDGVKEQPQFDVFDMEGHYLGSARLSFPIVPFGSIRVRSNRIYALARDESGVPSVVRSTPVEFD